MKIRHEINILNCSLSSSNSGFVHGPGLIYYDPAQYNGNLTCYLDVVAKNTDAAYDIVVTLVEFPSETSEVSVTVPANTTNFTRFRSSSFTPAVDTYQTRIGYISSSDDEALTVQAARLIIIQDTGEDDLTKSESQIEIGDYAAAYYNNETPGPLPYPKYWYYDSANWDGTVTVFGEICFQLINDKEWLSAWIQIDDGSFGNWANMSQILNQFGTDENVNRVRSADFSGLLISGRNYRLAVETEGTKAAYAVNFFSAKIVVVQTDASAITKLEEQYLMLNSEVNSGTGLQDYDTKYDPDEYSGVTVVLYHETNVYDGANYDADAKLQYDVTGTPIDTYKSSITDSLQRERSPAFDIPNLPFEFTILTLEEDDSFTLPIYDGGDYDFNVDWGDTSNDDIAAWDDAAVTHTYADSGASTYTITITGTIEGWRFNNAGDKLLIKDILSWGGLNLGNLGGYFYGCSNLTISASDILNTLENTTMLNAFNGCASLTTVPSMDSWDISNVTTTQTMFYGCTLFNQYIGSWNVSGIANMVYMFGSASAFNQNISGWITSALTTASSIFSEATAFDQDIGSWDVSGIANMSEMLKLATNFDQDISGWDTSSATNMSVMLFNAVNFNQNLGGWDIIDVTDMTNMLYGVTLSTANYDALLIGWEGQAVQDDVTFHAGNSTYNAGAAATAKAALIADHNWDITDGGEV